MDCLLDYIGIKPGAATVAQVVYGYSSVDPFVNESTTPAIVNSGSVIIPHHSDISVQFPAAAADKFLVFAVPDSESIKTGWSSTESNSGNIPGVVFRDSFVVGQTRYYVSRDAAGVSFDYTLPFKLIAPPSEEETGGTGEPESGLYIVSLPGISLESLAKTSDSDQLNIQNLWKDTQTEAGVRFKIDFISELQKCFKINKACDYEELICENKAILVNAWRYLLGNQLMIFRLHTNRLNRYTTIDLKDAAELADYYQVTYEKALSQAVQLIDASSCELCCGGNPEYVIMMP